MPANLLSPIHDLLPDCLVSFPGSTRRLVLDHIDRYALGRRSFKCLQPWYPFRKHRYALPLQFLAELRAFGFWWWRHFGEQHLVFVGGNAVDGCQRQYQHIRIEGRWSRRDYQQVAALRYGLKVFAFWPR